MHLIDTDMSGRVSHDATIALKEAYACFCDTATEFLLRCEPIPEDVFSEAAGQFWTVYIEVVERLAGLI